MDKLSKPMRDALQALKDEGRTMVSISRWTFSLSTWEALERRGLVEVHYEATGNFHYPMHITVSLVGEQNQGREEK